MGVGDQYEEINVANSQGKDLTWGYQQNPGSWRQDLNNLMTKT